MTELRKQPRGNGPPCSAIESLFARALCYEIVDFLQDPHAVKSLVRTSTRMWAKTMDAWTPGDKRCGSELKFKVLMLLASKQPRADMQKMLVVLICDYVEHNARFVGVDFLNTIIACTGVMLPTALLKMYNRAVRTQLTSVHDTNQLRRVLDTHLLVDEHGQSVLGTLVYFCVCEEEHPWPIIIDLIVERLGQLPQDVKILALQWTFTHLMSNRLSGAGYRLCLMLINALREITTASTRMREMVQVVSLVQEYEPKLLRRNDWLRLVEDGWSFRLYNELHKLAITSYFPKFVSWLSTLVRLKMMELADLVHTVLVDLVQTEQDPGVRLDNLLHLHRHATQPFADRTSHWRTLETRARRRACEEYKSRCAEERVLSRVT